MAEDQSEPGADNNRSANPENSPQESDNSSKDQKQIADSDPRVLVSVGEKTADDLKEDEKQQVESVKETHKDDDDNDDGKSDQSSDLVIDIPQAKEDEPKRLDETESDGLEGEKEKKKELKEKMKKDAVVDDVEREEPKEEVDAGSSKIDDNKETIIEQRNETEDCNEMKPFTEKVREEIKSKQSKDDSIDDKNLAEEVTKANEKAAAKDDDTVVSKDTSKKEDKDASEPEVGIVGPPTIASELLSEEELVTEKPALPTAETKPVVVSDRVVRWVEKTTSKADEPAVPVTLTIRPVDDPAEEIEDEDDEEVEEEEEDEVDEEDSDDCKRRTRSRKRKRSNGTNGTAGGPSTRKSQKVVGSIIRRSIRW